MLINQQLMRRIVHNSYFIDEIHTQFSGNKN